MAKTKRSREFLDVSEISDEDFDKLKWESVPIENINDRLAGMRIKCVEPIDYPLTDGFFFYLEDENDHLYSLDLTMDLFDDVVRLKIAEVTK